MKRGLALFLAALFVTLALSACGGGGGFAGSSGGSSTSSAVASEADYGGAYGIEEPAAASFQVFEEGQGEANSRLANAKMVYTANIEAETTDFDACTASLEALVDEMEGYMEYAAASRRGDGRRTANYTVRVPSARFEGFLKSVGDLSHVTDQNRSSENVSEIYYDIESRLTTQKTKLERLQALLARAENMEDIITLESAIAETELQIEQLTGSLRRYDALVDYATIQLYLQEVARLSTVEEAPPTFLSQLSNAFRDGLRSFGDFLQELAIFLAYNWIWLVVWALIIIAIVGVSRRRRKKREAAFRESGIYEGTPFWKKKEEPKNPDDKQGKD